MISFTFRGTSIHAAMRSFENYQKVQRVTGLHAVAVQPTAHGFDNSAVMDAVARSKGKMRAVVRFNEETSDAQLKILIEEGPAALGFR